MEILKHIKHNKIDFGKWDKTVLQSKTPLVFAQSFYLNATAGNWDALVIGDYDCVFPLTKKTKLGISYLPQPHFTSQLGAYGNVSLEREKLFYEYILKNFRLIEIELNANNKLKSGYISEKCTYIIEYKNDYKLNQNTKRNISRAEEEGLTVVACNENESEKYAVKYIVPLLKEKLKLPVKAIQTYTLLTSAAAENNMLFSFKVIDRNSQTRAFGQFICNGRHALYLKGSLADKNLKDGSMHFLMNYAVKYFENKADYFDFGGGSLSEGLADFYKGLGGKKLIYSYLKVNKLPGFIKMIKSKKLVKN